MAGLSVLLEAQKNSPTHSHLLISKTSLGKNTSSSSFSTSSFLEHCFLCRRRLQEGSDIFIYRWVTEPPTLVMISIRAYVHGNRGLLRLQGGPGVLQRGVPVPPHVYGRGEPEGGTLLLRRPRGCCRKGPGHTRWFRVLVVVVVVAAARIWTACFVLWHKYPLLFLKFPPPRSLS